MGVIDVVASAVGGHRAPGVVVAVSTRGAGVDATAVGADSEVLFEVGSITKLMTATLILQHVARGQIDLDDAVASHVPGFRLDPPEMSSSVTVRHLLTHTSGIDCGDEFTDTGDGDDCLEQLVTEAINGSSLLHRPGTLWSYSNGCYSVLGRLVEILDGRPWDDALIERILKPLGLSATTTARLTLDHRMAMGHRYAPDLGSMLDEPGRMPRSAGPAGNVVATAADLAEFAQALLDGNDRLLPSALVAEMIRPHTRVRGESQALGWSSPAPRVLVHGGATRGFTAFLGAVPELGALSVVANGPGAAGIAAAVQAHLFGRPPRQPPPRGDEHDIDVAACIGRYERRHVINEITWQDGELIATTCFGGPVAELFPQPKPARLTALGGGRFSSQHPHEDYPTLWDFTGPSRYGVPSLLLTNRLHKRTG